jgi:D-inositol-3-phosphate glycosyltransferase
VPFPVLRIALVCLHTSPGSEPGSGDAGGMNVVVRHQARALAALGHTVEILTRRADATSPDAVQLDPGVTLRLLSAGPAHPVAKGEHENFMAEFGARIAALGPYDIFHSHHWFSGVAALPVARELGVPHVISFHSIAADDASPLSAGERAESSGRRAGEAYLARESDLVITVSRAEADTVVDRLGGSASRVTIVSPGVDGTVFHPAERSPFGVSADSPADAGYVVVAGRLQPLKGLDLAIAAVAGVPAAVRPELVIAGDASDDFAGYIDELSELAASLGIKTGVRFVGPQSRSRLAALMCESRLVLVPSHSETYGLVALEASASGVPVVAAAAGGLCEAVLDGETGVLLHSREPSEWAAAITAVLTDEDLSDRLARNGRARAEFLTWTRSAEALLAAYRTLEHTGTRGELVPA